MLRSIIVGLLLLLVVTTAANAQQRSLCDRHTDAVRGTNASLSNTTEYQIMNSLARNLLLGNTTSNIQGLLNVSSPVLAVFAGNATYAKYPALYALDTARLLDRLTLFFGNGLGCTARNFRVYGILNDIATVYGSLNVTKVDMDFFILQARLSALSIGMTSLDVLTIVTPFLNGFNRCGGKELCNHDSCDVVPAPTDYACASRIQVLRIQEALLASTSPIVQAASDPILSTDTMVKIGAVGGSATLAGALLAGAFIALLPKGCRCRKGGQEYLKVSSA